MRSPLDEAEILGVVLAVIVLLGVLASTRWFIARVSRIQELVARDLQVSAAERTSCQEQIEHWQNRFYAERQARNDLWAQHQVLTAIVRDKLGFEEAQAVQARSKLVPEFSEQMRLVDLLYKSNLLSEKDQRDTLILALPEQLRRYLAGVRRPTPRGDLAIIVQTAAEWDPSAFRTLLDQIEDTFEHTTLVAVLQDLRQRWNI